MTFVNAVINFFIVSPKDRFDSFIGEELKIGERHSEMFLMNYFDGVEVQSFPSE
jgi:hypothetical protein